jgi:exopolysaccharide biosynthesis polyprenyl glycosylphosphotransferase
MSQAIFGTPENAIAAGAVGATRRSATTGAGLQARRGWTWARRYRIRLVVTDAAIIAVAATFSMFLRHETDLEPGRIAAFALGATLWLAALAAFDTRNDRTVGAGATEYKAILDATVAFLGVLLTAGLVFRAGIERTDVIPAVPVAFLVLLASRWAWRQWLARQRRAGRFVSRTVLIGSSSTIEHTALQFQRHPDAGYLVVGSVPPESLFDAHDVVGSESAPSSALQNMLEAQDADTVVLTSSDYLTPERIRALGWQLERASQRLIISPSLNDVAGSRIQTQPAAGLPLIHVEAPTYTGVQRVLKRLVDIVGSLVLLLLFTPALLVIAAIVRLTTAGPVLYVQERIGRGERSFGILKFRSMVLDADATLDSLLAGQQTQGTPLFKVHADPRVTAVGRVLRRYSLDELPQLINVLRGEMSLVGPRPQRPLEVALYDSTARRRLAVRPGMSGLWQVSGRSRLSWDEALRLDLYYIENCSLVADLVILWRTAKAVIGSDGAY